MFRNTSRIYATKTSDPELSVLLTSLLNQPATTSTEERWKHVRDAIHDAARITISNREKYILDWLEKTPNNGISHSNNEVRVALISFKMVVSSAKSLVAPRIAKNVVEKTARCSSTNTG